MGLPRPAAGRTAVVTGASGGIGAEIARALSRRGQHVTLVARTIGKLAALADELGNADAIPCDLADRSARAGLLDQVRSLGREPHVLVNNAGFSTLGPVAASDPESEMAMVEVDVVAVVDLCSRFVPGMIALGSGAVLNVASTAAFQPLPGQAGYGAGKAFVLSYTQSLAGELHGTGVTATTLCPGPVDTGFGARAGFSDEDAKAALPPVMWLAPAAVAEQAVAGMERGRLVVIPGVANRFAAAAARVAPRRLLLPILAKNHPGLK